MKKLSKLDVAIEILLLPEMHCIFQESEFLEERKCPKIDNSYAKCKKCLRRYINEEFKIRKKEGFYSWE